MSTSAQDRPTPIAFSTDGEAQPLERIPFGSPLLDEKRLQGLIARFPETLPISQLAPGNSPAFCIGRETGTGAGNLDNLCISPTGAITLVETKLWKNPDARRRVVGQIVDYAKQVCRWSYSTLDSKARDYLQSERGWSGSLYSWLSEQTEELEDEATFIDRVSENLHHGRFLLLIVGDGIRKDVEEMVSYLQASPQLQFHLALVEMGCYRDPRQEGLCLIVPHVVARTKEIERAVVRVELVGEAKHVVTTTTHVPSTTIKLSSTEETFYSAITGVAGEIASNRLRGFVQLLRDEVDAVEVTCQKNLLVTARFAVGESDRRIWLLMMTPDGKVRLGGQHKWKAEQFPREVIEAYWNDVASLVPAIKPVIVDEEHITMPFVRMTDILSRLDGITKAIHRFVAAVEASTSD